MNNRTPLSEYTDAELHSEVARRRVAKRTVNRGTPKVMAPCKLCGKILSATERRRACPAHSLAQRTKA